MDFALRPERVCKSKSCIGSPGEYVVPIDRDTLYRRPSPTFISVFRTGASE